MHGTEVAKFLPKLLGLSVKTFRITALGSDDDDWIPTHTLANFIRQATDLEVLQLGPPLTRGMPDGVVSAAVAEHPKLRWVRVGEEQVMNFPL